MSYPGISDSKDTASSPPPLPRVWYTTIDDNQEGPFTVEQLRGQIRSGKINATTLVWKEGMADWEPCALILEFTDIFETSYSGTGRSGHTAIDVGKKSASAAFQAFKTMAVDPLTGLEAAYHSVGRTTALSVSIVFGIVYVFSIIFLINGDLTSNLTFFTWFRIILAAAVPFVCVGLGLLVARKSAGSDESFHSDVFVASSISLLAGFYLIAVRILGVYNYALILALFIVLLCYIQFILFSALTRIYGIREAVATFGVPAIIIGSLWLGWVLLRAILQDEITTLTNPLLGLL